MSNCIQRGLVSIKFVLLKYIVRLVIYLALIKPIQNQVKGKFQNDVVDVTSTLLSYEVVKWRHDKQILDFQMLNFHQSLPC